MKDLLKKFLQQLTDKPMTADTLHKTQRLLAWTAAAVSCDVDRRMTASVGMDDSADSRVLLDERYTYSDQVFRAIVTTVRGPRVQQRLLSFLASALLSLTSLERLVLHAAAALMTLWEAILFTRTMHLAVCSNTTTILRSENNLKRAARAWQLWWIKTLHKETSTLIIPASCGEGR